MTNQIQTRIWREEAEADNPFATRKAYCRGYDVYGELVGNIRWVEMLLLLFRDELPEPPIVDLLEALAVAMINAGPRDSAVHAAMCGGTCGSPAAASLMSALAVGAGRLGGAREVFDAMQIWQRCGDDFSAWPESVTEPNPSIDIWPSRESPPGFDPYGVQTPLPVTQLIQRLAVIGGTPRLSWLLSHRPDLEHSVGKPLSLTGVAAAALADMGLSPQEGEMLFLLLRLPGAAAHALEQGGLGHKAFPFYPVELTDDPGAATA